jgi:hypothetical protein
LAIDALLGNVEVLDIEEAFLAEGGDESLCELLLALRGVVQGEVESDELSPVEVFL